MMTLDVSRETWDDMVFAAQRELKALHSRNREEVERRIIANSIRAALRVMQIDLTET